MMTRVLALALILVMLPGGESAMGAGAPMLDLATVKTARGEGGKMVEVQVAEGTAHLSFPEQGKSVFATAALHADASWDRAEGFSFWVKGDGSRHLGGLQFIWNENYALRYDYAFALEDAEWRKVTVAWEDLIPVLPAPEAKLLAGTEGNAPGRLSQCWFGKWWYWRDDVAYAYSVRDFQLEQSVPRDGSDYRPAEAPLSRVSAKVRAGEPITVVTMGDSLTDEQHWSNRTTNWPLLLKQALKERDHCEVTVVNPALGGTQLRQNLVLMPSWLRETPAPDLVTIFFGYNDWDAGMRGPMFRSALVDAVKRIRRATKGKTEVLIMTTAPSLSKWATMTELAEAGREAAREVNAGLADVEAAFHEVSEAERRTLFADDGTHLSKAGQVRVMEKVEEKAESEKRKAKTKNGLAAVEGGGGE